MDDSQPQDHDAARAALREYTLAKYAPPRLFCIVSWGCAATRWLSVCLNSHPDVFCVHDQRFFWRTFADSRALTDAEYLRLVGMQGHGHLLAGDVHGIARSSIAGLHAELGADFRCAVVVRHPVERALSAVRLWNEFRPEAVGVAYLLEPAYAPIRHLLIDRDAMLFAHALKLSTAIVEEQKAGPVFRSEDLTTDPAAFARLFAHIAGGTLDRPHDFGAFIGRAERINRHRPKPGLALAPSHRALFDFIVDGDSKRAYRELGYDIDG